MAASHSQKAIVLESRDKPVTLQQIPIPEVCEGAAVVKIVATVLPPMARGIFTGQIPFPLSLPLVPGNNAIARIHALGSDATTLSEGQLVFVDIWVRARDNPNASILQGYLGGYDPLSSKLMAGDWRNGTLAEFAKVPLENIYSLDEELLTKDLGYSYADLNWLGPCLIPAGGLMEIDIKGGDCVIVAPGTGFFSGAAVSMALGMGARVIAVGRNMKVLSQMTKTFAPTGRFQAVQLSGDVEKDSTAIKAATPSNAGADAMIDFSPPSAGKSTHFMAAFLTLRPFGKCALMGNNMTNVEIPYIHTVSNSIRIQGRYMYTRDNAIRAIRLLETGMLQLGAGEKSGIQAQVFKFDEIEKALDISAGAGWGTMVVMEP